MNFLNFFSTFVGHFLPSGSGSGSSDLIESGSETLPVTEVGVLITAVGVPVTEVGVPVSSFNVSDEVATAAAVVGNVVGVAGKLQNCMIVVTTVHDSDTDQHLICHSGSKFCSIVSLIQ
jgi:hypothetical protein